ncbi:hypothetical protein KCU83_g125, partial [Aureobasidium melanogenum]
LSLASNPQSRHSPPHPSNMLESCPSIVRHDRRRSLVSAITVTVTVLAPTHARSPLPVLLVRLALDFKHTAFFASASNGQVDIPNAINALLRHVPNPFLMRRQVTTCSYILASSSAHQHLPRSESTKSLTLSSHSAKLFRTHHSLPLTRLGPRAKVIALDIVRHGLSSSASALVLIVARDACGGTVVAVLVSVGIPPAPERRMLVSRFVFDVDKASRSLSRSNRYSCIE